MSAAILAAGESTIGPTLAVIVGTGMAAQWLAWRTQIPSIIALLLAGLVLGPVTGVINPDELLGGSAVPARLAVGRDHSCSRAGSTCLPANSEHRHGRQTPDHDRCRRQLPRRLVCVP